MKTLPGKITISRPRGSGGDDYISIEIQDNASLGRIVQVKVPLANFAEAITGQGYIDCTLEYYPQDHIGMTREHKTEFVPFKTNYTSDKELRRNECQKAVEPFEVDGWKAQTLGDLTNHHKYAKIDNVEGQYVVFIRYVDGE